MFAASDLGIDSIGIELLPIGQELIKARNILQNSFAEEDFSRLLFWKTEKPWLQTDTQQDFLVLRITQTAYSDKNTTLIKKYLSCVHQETEKVQGVLRFALCCVLETISFTRKDGQYLRWDQQSGRCLRAIPFDKGAISDFTDAITGKLEEIIDDSLGRDKRRSFDSCRRGAYPPALRRNKGIKP